MVIPWYGLVFFICYLVVIWFINALMMRSLRGMAGQKKKQHGLPCPISVLPRETPCCFSAC